MMKNKWLIYGIMAMSWMITLHAQSWQPDLGNGRYRNPVLMADYSDPDVCRVGDDFYMTSSSFNCVPALQILHSRDLVNWEIIGAASPGHVPQYQDVHEPLYGKGVWAPSIRWHDGRFYIFYGDPDKGIVRLTAERIEGPWEERLVMPAVGYIDPCPLWDDDGRVWLVHALAGSRAGLKSVLLLAELDSTASQVISPSRIIFDGHETQPTCEGPKLYKRDSLYYIFHPAGGVRTGWQTVLRSEHVDGPYEEKIVLHQGKTQVNGPHQGAWVTAPDGSDWFLHFQDRGAYGRVVHLQPMTWHDGWPVMGSNGDPVQEYRKPVQGQSVSAPATSDEFNAAALGWQWQWMAQPEAKWWFCDQRNGWLRLFSVAQPQPTWDNNNPHYWHTMQPNLLMQKFPAENFTVSARVRLCPDARYKGEQGGLVLSGEEFHTLALVNTDNGCCLMADDKNVTVLEPWQWVWLRVQVWWEKQDVHCRFDWSRDGKHYAQAGKTFILRQQKNAWIGSKVGIFCTRPYSENKRNDGGWLDIDQWQVMGDD